MESVDITNQSALKHTRKRGKEDRLQQRRALVIQCDVVSTGGTWYDSFRAALNSGDHKSQDERMNIMCTGIHGSQVCLVALGKRVAEKNNDAHRFVGSYCILSDSVRCM